ncbi:hypothetical protein BS78_02G200300 [Paspalum vaginatum]|nr:hypothetical protein BS78_02G200300 [Paspalum vaginatum]
MPVSPRAVRVGAGGRRRALSLPGSDLARRRCESSSVVVRASLPVGRWWPRLFLVLCFCFLVRTDLQGHRQLKRKARFFISAPGGAECWKNRVRVCGVQVRLTRHVAGRETSCSPSGRSEHPSYSRLT